MQRTVRSLLTFRNACHKFILTEILRPAAPVEKALLAPGVDAASEQVAVSPPRKAHGFKKLSDLVRAKTDIFATEERVPEGQTQKVLYVRAK